MRTVEDTGLINIDDMFAAVFVIETELLVNPEYEAYTADMPPARTPLNKPPVEIEPIPVLFQTTELVKSIMFPLRFKPAAENCCVSEPVTEILFAGVIEILVISSGLYIVIVSVADLPQSLIANVTAPVSPLAVNKPRFVIEPKFIDDSV